MNRRVDKSVVLYGDVVPYCVGCDWPDARAIAPEKVEAEVVDHVQQTGHAVMVPDVAAIRYKPAGPPGRVTA